MFRLLYGLNHMPFIKLLVGASNMQVISVATGTKCINGEHLSLQGQCINDCHAEIMARRCLLHFLFGQLEKLVQWRKNGKILFSLVCLTNIYILWCKTAWILLLLFFLHILIYVLCFFGQGEVIIMIIIIFASRELSTRH